MIDSKLVEVGAFGERAGRRGWEATRSGATRAEQPGRIREVIPDASGSNNLESIIQMAEVS